MLPFTVLINPSHLVSFTKIILYTDVSRDVVGLSSYQFFPRQPTRPLSLHHSVGVKCDMKTSLFWSLFIFPARSLSL